LSGGLAVARGAEARHGKPDSLLEGSDVRPNCGFGEHFHGLRPFSEQRH